MEGKKSVGYNFHKASDTDRSENTKVIVRRFDMPTRNSSQSHVCVSTPQIGAKYPLAIQTQKERWKYQYQIDTDQSPESVQIKHVTKVYPGRKAKIMTQPVNATLQSASFAITPSVQQELNVSEVLSNTTMFQLINNKDLTKSVDPEGAVLFYPSKTDNVETPKIVEPIDYKTLSERITSNISDTAVGNSLIVDTKLVNGKKVFILKTLKDINNAAPKSQTLSESTTSLVNVEKQHKMIPTVNKLISVIRSGSGDPLHLNNANVVPSVIPSNKLITLSSVTVPHQDTVRSVSDSQVQSAVDLSDSNTDSNLRKNDSQKLSGSSVSSSPLIVVDELNSNSTGISHQVTLCLNDKTHNQAKYVKLDSVKGDDNISKENERTVFFEILPQNELRSKSEDKVLLAANQKALKTSEHETHSLVINASSLKRKFVQADSTTSVIAQVSEGSVSEKQMKLSNSVIELQLVDHNENPSEILTANQNINQMCFIDSPCLVPLQSTDSIVDSSLITKQNTNNKIAVLPKQSIKDQILYRIREQIALQYQQQILKAKVVPRVTTTVERAARKVQLVDISTQTSLFSLLEPGRIVEMHVNDSSEESENSESANTESDSLENQSLLFISQSLNSTEDAVVGSVPISVGENISSRSCVKETTKEVMDSISPKRLRMDTDANLLTSFIGKNQTEIYNRSNRHVNTNVLDQQIDDHNSKGPLNINDKLMLVCKKLFGPSCDNANIEDTKIKVIRRALKDYQASLTPDEDGNMPIHNAVLDKHPLRVKKYLHILCAQKHTVDVKNSQGETPLHLAVLSEATEIVQDLIKRGADPSLPDSHGDTSLHMAISWGNKDLFQIIMKCVDKFSPVLNKANDEGYSPLHICALKNKEDEAVILIKKGADINLRDRKSGRTPLFHAVENRNTKMSRTLIELGASTTAQNFSGQTPLSASELSLEVTGTDKGEEEELYIALCRHVTQVNDSESTSFCEKRGSFQNRTNIDMVAANCKETVFPPNVMDGTYEPLQQPESSQSILKFTNR